MSTKNESYIGTVKPDLRPRHRAVMGALNLLRDLVNTHAFAEEDGNEGQIEMPLAYRDLTQSSGKIWFDFRHRNGDPLTPVDVLNETIDGRIEADMILGEDTEDGLPVATFTTSPPNVLGYDRAPLTTSEIGRVVMDLKHYEAAVQAGHLVAPAGQPITGEIIPAIAY